MPIFMPGTGEGATPNRSLPPGGAAFRLRSAAGRNLGAGASSFESAKAIATRVAGDADCATSEDFGFWLLSLFASLASFPLLFAFESTNGMASAWCLDAEEAD